MVMGFRFRKSVRIAPGLRINLGKKSASLSVGSRGATVNISDRGVKTTVGVPGTGMSYSEKVSSLSVSSSGSNSATSSKAFYIFAILVAALMVYLITKTPAGADIDGARDVGEGSEISDKQYSRIEDEKDAARAKYELDNYNQEYEERYAKEVAATAASPSVQAELPEIAAVVDEVALPPLIEEPVNK
jgi:hypothetical protein